jgi:molybdopterin-guanine dinucleotide biosynthesis protein A
MNYYKYHNLSVSITTAFSGKGIGLFMDAVILAGGENTRIPARKGFIGINGRSIMESDIALFHGLVCRSFISTNEPEVYFYLGASLVGDVISQRGPMSGIFSALVSPGVSEVFVVACDMPFINVSLVKYIIDRWEDKWDAAVPLFNGESQPLLGIYSRKIAARMEDSIRSGRRSLRGFLERISVLYIGEDAVRRIDGKGRSFVNINTMEDLRREGLKAMESG